MKSERLTLILTVASFIGVMGIVGYEYFQAIELQKQLASFVNKGPRFTADDGQQLCERLAEHERFHGLPSRPCEYKK